MTESRIVPRLVVLALVALVGFLALYAVAVQTEIGQRADEAALTGGRAAPTRAQEAASRLLQVVSVGTIAVAIAVLALIARARRSRWPLLLPAAIIGGSLIATEVLKLLILPRPDLLLDPRIVENTYPSGHTTVAVSIGLAALVVAPPRFRARVAIGAATLAAAAGVFVVTAEWHLPSDPIGSYLLTLAVTAIVLAILHARRPELARRELAPGGGPSPPAVAGRVERLAVLAALGLFFGAIVYASLRYGPDVNWNRFHAAYLLASAAIVVVAGATVGALLRALGPTRSTGP